ncbi:MAG: divalent metal cation transporter, partial [Bacillota bacterium]
KIPPVLMRLVTMAPAIVIIAMNVNPIDALVISQVILSFALPAAIVPLMLITRRQDLMGKLVNRPTVNYIGWTITSVIIGLNALLLYLTFTGNV